jgi:hypothetical protein
MSRPASRHAIPEDDRSSVWMHRGRMTASVASWRMPRARSGGATFVVADANPRRLGLGSRSVGQGLRWSDNLFYLSGTSGRAAFHSRLQYGHLRCTVTKPSLISTWKTFPTPSQPGHRDTDSAGGRGFLVIFGIPNRSAEHTYNRM